MKVLLKTSLLVLLSTTYALSINDNSIVRFPYSSDIPTTCPEVESPNETIHLAHETNCSLFYKCDHGKKELQECPGGLHFNPRKQICDYPSKAGCIQLNTTTTTARPTTTSTARPTTTSTARLTTTSTARPTTTTIRAPATPQKTTLTTPPTITPKPSTPKTTPPTPKPIGTTSTPRPSSPVTTPPTTSKPSTTTPSPPVTPQIPSGSGIFIGNNFFQASKQIFNLYINSTKRQNQTIPNDYVIVPGIGAYKLHSSVVNWNDARNACVKEGAHLPVIRSPREHEYLKKITKEKQVHIWLGVHDLFKKNDWTTVQDEPLASIGYAPWNAGEPNNLGGNERCVQFNVDRGMNDLRCEGTPQNFFCKIDLK